MDWRRIPVRCSAQAFKEITGQTVHGYVMALRVSRAEELLSKSEMPLCEIALPAGFSSQSHLTAQFGPVQTEVLARRLQEWQR
jgi:transcriptional regulator GlxA family with amidase domain